MEQWPQFRKDIYAMVDILNEKDVGHRLRCKDLFVNPVIMVKGLEAFFNSIRRRHLQEKADENN